MTVYHVTPRRNLGSIMRWGLIPRDPTVIRPGHPCWGAGNAGVRAVYVHRTRASADLWNDHFLDRYYDVPVAVLQLDITGLPLEPDAYNPDVWSRVLARVEPGRIGRAA